MPRKGPKKKAPGPPPRQTVRRQGAMGCPSSRYQPPALGRACPKVAGWRAMHQDRCRFRGTAVPPTTMAAHRSEEHTSELQSHLNLVCRLLLEKKNSQLNCGEIRTDGVDV